MTQANGGSLGALYHPLEGKQLENPYPFYARARKEGPIFFSPELDSWIVTRYNDVRTALSQQDVFSSKDAKRPAEYQAGHLFSQRSLELIEGGPTTAP